VSPALPTPSAAALARIAALSERRLSDAEWAAATTPEDLAEMRAPIRWFRRRYPTPAARLAWARATYRQWARSMPG